MRRSRPLAFVASSVLCAACAPPSSGPSISARFADRAEGEPPLTVVAYGTSFTAGATWFGPVAAAIEAEYPGASVWTNAAESTRSSVWALENLAARVLALEPDIVFLEFAINDAFVDYAIDVETSIANLEELVDRILAVSPDADVVVLVTNPVVDEGVVFRPQLRDYYAAWREYADERGLLVVDEEPVWEELDARSHEAFRRLVPDGGHPSPQGHALVNAPLILDALHGRPSDADAIITAAIDAVTP